MTKIQILGKVLKQKFHYTFSDGLEVLAAIGAVIIIAIIACGVALGIGVIAIDAIKVHLTPEQAKDSWLNLHLTYGWAVMVLLSVCGFVFYGVFRFFKAIVLFFINLKIDVLREIERESEKDDHWRNK